MLVFCKIQIFSPVVAISPWSTPSQPRRSLKGTLTQQTANEILLCCDVTRIPSTKIYWSKAKMQTIKS